MDDPLSREVAGMIASNFRIPTVRYQLVNAAHALKEIRYDLDEWFPYPNTMVLGNNKTHEFATFLTMQPSLVVFDEHTEMMNRSRLAAGNWLYWKLLTSKQLFKGRYSAHLVLPYSGVFHGDILIPEGAQDKLTVYALKRRDGHFKARTDSKMLVDVPVKDWTELRSLQGPLQVSVDMDIFNPSMSDSVVEALKALPRTDGDIYDVWLDGEDAKDQYEKWVYLFRELVATP